MMEQYNTEFEEGEEEEGDEGLSVSPDCHVTTFNPFPTIIVISLISPGTSSLHVTRAVFTATTLAVITLPQYKSHFVVSFIFQSLLNIYSCCLGN